MDVNFDFQKHWWVYTLVVLAACGFIMRESGAAKPASSTLDKPWEVAASPHLMFYHPDEWTIDPGRCHKYPDEIMTNIWWSQAQNNDAGFSARSNEGNPY